MTKDEALKMAIEVLEHGSNLELVKVADIRKALKACKEALEQPAQEPVGYTTKFDLETACQGNTLLWFANKNGKYNVALYTHPAPQPAQEPVACPYPCGWNNLHKALIEQGAYLIRRRGEDTSKDEVFDEFLCSVNDIARYLCEWGKKLTHPAPSWQGLSDTEIAFMAVPFYDADNLIANEFGFARFIEQALKEKNT